MIQTTPKTFVFVLMPLSSEFDDVYKLGIKAACSDAGAYCERVDEQIYEESILERIYNQISKADLLVADMTGRNPNVFYEVGYAHALDKRVILLTQRLDDIPFDLKHYPHIVYAGHISDLKVELTKRIRWAIENPKDVEKFFKTNIEVSVNGTSLVDNPQIHYLLEEDKTRCIELEINVHNSTKKIIEPASFQVGLITSPDVSGSFYSSEFPRKKLRLSNTSYLSLIQNTFEILPGSWDTFIISLIAEEKINWILGEQLQITLRVFSRSGTQDYPFTIKLDKKSP